MTQAPSLRQISKCAVKPQRIIEESQQPCHLTPWDISVLSTNYIQKGLIFEKPQETSVNTIIDQLKDSLSQVLTHFFPLAGRLVTKKSIDPPSYSIFLDCTDPPGAEFIHATFDASISDFLDTIDVAPIVDSMFALDKPINHDGHTLPLLAVQVTELIDGIFVACSMNHVAGDGTSFWHFLSSWSEICRGKIECISRPPITKRWFLDGRNNMINLPFSHPDEFIERYVPLFHREKMFHFSSLFISQLKAKANSECSTTSNTPISSFQALAAHIWRSVIRARRLPVDYKTICWLAIDDRSRLDPPLSKDYFGNCILAVNGTTTVGRLLENNLGWAAMILHKSIHEHTNLVVRGSLQWLMESPFVYHFGKYMDNTSIVSFGSSPRFDVFGNDFGWGKPIAVQSGYGNKFDGKVGLYPGSELDGSVDMELCLLPDSMSALEVDEEFVSRVSS